MQSNSYIIYNNYFLFTMDNPYAITIHCDGAMKYDSKQTGGNGFIIEFPESINHDPIGRYYRNDGQGIHRLEMISIIEAIDELLSFEKKNPGTLRKSGGVIIYSDRFNVTDSGLSNPYRVQRYRRNKWKTYENKPVKDKELLDRIDKARKKLSGVVYGRVEIKYKKEKSNKIADKLSRQGRQSTHYSKKLIPKKNRQVSPRKFDGREIAYDLLQQEDSYIVHVYAWERVQDEIEVVAEIVEGQYIGRTIRIYISPELKSEIHRHHCYEIQIAEVYSHHIKIKSLNEKKE